MGKEEANLGGGGVGNLGVHQYTWSTDQVGGLW